MFSALQSLSSKRVVLASASPRRRALLELLGINADICPSTFDESLDKHSFPQPADYSLETSRQKCLQVAQQLSSPFDLIIAADTVVSFKNQILEKPATPQDAHRMLTLLSGNTHIVCTGVTLLYQSSTHSTPQILQFHEETKVTFHDFDEKTILEYISTGEPFDKAGAYGIQSMGAILVRKIDGCYYNVVGFPLHKFCKTILSMDS